MNPLCIAWIHRVRVMKTVTMSSGAWGRRGGNCRYHRLPITIALHMLIFALNPSLLGELAINIHDHDLLIYGVGDKLQIQSGTKSM